MLKKRVIISLLFNKGVLYRTRNFVPNNIYTHNFIDTWSVDEIIMLDISRSDEHKSEFEGFMDLVGKISKNCFVPLSVGGKISSVADAEKCLAVGADKLVINSNGFKKHTLISDIAKKYGSQCVVVSIDVKKICDQYFVFIENGQTNTGVLMEEWIVQAQEFGAGEIFLNSIDKDGMLDGYDLELIRTASKNVDVPLVACGGAGSWGHFAEAFSAGADGACTTNIFHFTENSINSAKNFLKNNNINIRF